jgi:hypothetical protein
MRRALTRNFALLLLLASLSFARAQNNNDVTNEWRITGFPHYPIHGNLTGFGYLGWVKNPQANYTLWYGGYPGLTYNARPHIQVWGGFFNIYTNNYTNINGKQDTLELRPFIGGKFFLPNHLKWNIYNFTRLEFREIYHHDTHEWTNTERLRFRFAVEAPLTSSDKAWHERTFYGMVGAEPYYRFDKSDIDPFRLMTGVGYVAKNQVRAELLYYANWGRVAPTNDLAFTENIIRLNIKFGVTHSILSHVWNPTEQ